MIRAAKSLWKRPEVKQHDNLFLVSVATDKADCLQTIVGRNLHISHFLVTRQMQNIVGQA